MYPHERSLVKQLADKPFALVGVNSDSDLDEIREIVKEKNLTWRSFQDEGNEVKISDTWKIEGWPTVFILDAEGTIRFKGHGPNDAMIETCLAEIGHEVSLKHESEDEENADDPESETDAEDDGDQDADAE